MTNLNLKRWAEQIWQDDKYFTRSYVDQIWHHDQIWQDDDLTKFDKMNYTYKIIFVHPTPTHLEIIIPLTS